MPAEDAAEQVFAANIGVTLTLITQPDPDYALSDRDAQRRAEEFSQLAFLIYQALHTASFAASWTLSWGEP